jgi:hypothetical protein
MFSSSPYRSFPAFLTCSRTISSLPSSFSQSRNLVWAYWAGNPAARQMMPNTVRYTEAVPPPPILPEAANSPAPLRSEAPASSLRCRFNSSGRFTIPRAVAIPEGIVSPQHPEHLGQMGLARTIETGYPDTLLLRGSTGQGTEIAREYPVQPLPVLPLADEGLKFVP